MNSRAKEIILIGGSAGAYKLIVEIMDALPISFACSIVILLHRNERYSTQMEETLSSQLGRRIQQASDKGEILEGNIYFAPPGYHLLIEPNISFSLDVSERIQFSRPSIDVLFETAADVYGANCTAFLLSGANRDGSDGLRIIRNLGGRAIVQSPTDAQISFMPSYAIESIGEVEVYNNNQIINYFKTLN